MSASDPEVLDLVFLSSQTAGDSALESELLCLLMGQCSDLLPLLDSDGESAARRDAAHSLRGAAAGLGAARLSATAAAIERGQEPTVAIGQAVAELREAVERRLAEREGGRRAA